MIFNDFVSVIRDFNVIKVIDAITREVYYLGTKHAFPLSLFDKMWKYEIDNVHSNVNVNGNSYLIVEVFE